MRVLIVEDEERIRRDLKSHLQTAGYVVQEASNGEEAWFLGDTEEFDAVVLDIGLPKLDGLSVLKKWRDAGRNFPILVLTARGGWTDRVEGIDGGADDYLVKPFELRELQARMRALIRRRDGHAQSLIGNGELQLDLQTRELSCRGTAVGLSAREFALLHALLERPGAILSREQLEQRIYGWGEEVSSNAVEVLIHGLRKKLGAEAIRNVRGLGWRVAKSET